ncbi:DUF4422 domain-containing protein [Allisonella histaminiformans]|uniref:DUF4422 domain-containing protein n=1 Tax=Allisonella histaminiformans TaxID=209880 RepID=UPI003520FFF8
MGFQDEVVESGKDIKIFVSCRIDTDSNLIHNPLYVPVRCGAVFDTSSSSKYLGDNSGDNISDRRNSFCEFTVQYWAWKNVKADYYGLCHYRRYLTFSKKEFRANAQEQVMEGMLDNHAIAKYDLLNEKRMRSIIEGCDAVVNEAADVNHIPTPLGFQHSVYNHWAAHDGMFFDKRVIPLLMETIHELKPQYYEDAVAYMHDKWHRGYNCYVMKKDLFDEMCSFQFPIMFAMEMKLSENGMSNQFGRTLGYLGEMMYGIFIYYLEKQHKYKIKSVQLVYFEQTVPPNSILQRLIDRFLFWAKFRFENIGYRLLPKNTRRRNFVKKIYFSIVKR